MARPWTHDDVMKWKQFPRYWPFVWGIHRPVEFPTQRPVTRSFDVFFDLRLNKRLSKQPWGWWFETLSWSLWRYCNVTRFTPYLVPKTQLCIYLNFTHIWDEMNNMMYINWLLLSEKLQFILYYEKIAVCLKGAFYWTSKSSISVENGVFFKRGYQHGCMLWSSRCQRCLSRLVPQTFSPHTLSPVY